MGALPLEELAPAAVDAAAEAGTGVVVRFGPGRYAIPMSAIAEVGRLSRVTRVPGVPLWVAGVSNWRGRILPVIDLRPLLGVPASDVAQSARLVVTGDETASVGLLVEAVEGVATLPAGDLDRPPATVVNDAADLLAGQWNDNVGPIGVIDVGSVLRLRSRLPRERGRN
ncbi:MAG: chemotaxis protein CheW [Actinomycetes bacterium]